MKKNTFYKLSIALLIFFSFITIATAVVFFIPNVKNTKDNALYIREGENFDKVKNSLYSKNLIRLKSAFELVAMLKNYPLKIKAGKYVLTPLMNNLDVLNKLRSGSQTPVILTFNNIRNVKELSDCLSRQLMADSTELQKIFTNEDYLAKYGFKKENITAIFLPNSYEVYWTIKPEQLLERFYKEYEKFWNKSRLLKANKLKLSSIEITILASIVEKETRLDYEKRIIAGIYLNRLRKNMRLCADPTVIYAVGNYNLRRVLRSHLKIDSPYNTYKYEGLPPGPICIPESSSIDAVLDATKHPYLFFCAREDFSGSHNFAVKWQEHEKNAQLYHKALVKRLAEQEAEDEKEKIKELKK